MDKIKVMALGGLDEEGKDLYVIEVNDDKHLIRSNVPNSHNAVGYIDIKVSLGNIRINVPIKTLWGIIKNLNIKKR